MIIAATLTVGRAKQLEDFLGAAHDRYESSECHTSGTAFFHKEMRYEDYKLRPYLLLSKGGSVVAADWQFSKPSLAWRFREDKTNKRLLALLNAIARQRYDDGSPFKEIHQRGSRFWHYGFAREHFDAGDIERWGTETLITYEPDSAGQADAGSTKTRTDFVILRFRRRHRVPRSCPEPQ